MLRFLGFQVKEPDARHAGYDNGPSLMESQSSADNKRMNYRVSARTIMPALGARWLVAGNMARGQSVTVTPAPGNIIIYLFPEATTMPAAQNVNVTSSAPGATYTTTITPTGSTLSSLWLTATPDSGTLPAKVSLRVNPTGLEVRDIYGVGRISRPRQFRPARQARLT